MKFYKILFFVQLHEVIEPLEFFKGIIFLHLYSIISQQGSNAVRFKLNVFSQFFVEGRMNASRYLSTNPCSYISLVIDRR